MLGVRQNIKPDNTKDTKQTNHQTTPIDIGHTEYGKKLGSWLVGQEKQKPISFQWPFPTVSKELCLRGIGAI